MGCLGKYSLVSVRRAVDRSQLVAAGVLWCITIVGIPIGKQCFKFAKLAFFPFGKEVEYGGSAVSVVCNIFG